MRNFMDDILISSVKLLRLGHPRHGQVLDIRIRNGKIADMAEGIEPTDNNTRIIDGRDCFAAPGFFDLNANFGEPGLETKEDIATGTAAAAAGGFTGVAVQPNTEPPLHGRSEVALIVNRAKGNLVDVHPIGTISKKRAGKELTELYDMKTAGAVAFGDGDRSVQQAGLMGRALLYSKGFGGLLIAFPEDESISGGHPMNEGETSTFLGMKGKPNLSESMMVARDLFLAEYNEAPIHFTTLSTAESVELIERAKAKGLPVTCDVAAHHLALTDAEVASFDSHYKVNPPLRTRRDVDALLKAVKNGTIDAIVSQHTPHEVEFKNVEFHIARDGIIGLQTALPFLVKAGLEPEMIVQKLSIAPREILHLPVPALEVGTMANLVVFSLTEKWTFDRTTNRSKSANSPLFGQELTGRAVAAVNNGQLAVVH